MLQRLKATLQVQGLLYSSGVGMFLAIKLEYGIEFLPLSIPFTQVIKSVRIKVIVIESDARLCLV